MARRFHCDALLINYHGTIPDGLDEHLRHLGLPAVWLIRQRESAAVVPDEIAAGKLATAQLIALGHRRISYMNYHFPWRTAADTHFSVIDRRAGYRLVMREANLEPRVIELDPLVHDPLALKRLVTTLVRSPLPPTPGITNRGGSVWILGYKTEGANTGVRTEAKGRTEILGANIYACQTWKSERKPAFTVRDSQFTAAASMICHWGPANYAQLLEATADRKQAVLAGSGRCVWQLLTSGQNNLATTP